MKDVKALITLRSGKKIEQPIPKPHVEKEEEIKKEKEIFPFLAVYSNL